MIKSESIINLLPALVSAKQKFGTIIKNKSGYGYNYATIDEILDKIEKPLLEAGLFIAHDRDIEKMEMTSYVYHVSGEYIGTKIKLDVQLSNKMNFMQNFGSSSTYAIRYNLIALFNLCAEEDDDGAASGKPVGQEQKDDGVSSGKPKSQQPKKETKQQEKPTEEQQLNLIKQKLLPYITHFGLKDDVVKLCGINPQNWSIENVEEIKKMIKLKKEANESNN
jgi:hypothetical protein